MEDHIFQDPLDVEHIHSSVLPSLKNQAASKTYPSSLKLQQLLLHFQKIRSKSLAIAKPLSEEDMQIQSMPDASPIKWHLAHTSWGFETFVLKPFTKNYQTFNSDYEYLFNSYYNAIGKQFPRSQRGLLSRPSYQEVLQYRQYIDKAILELIQRSDLIQRNENNHSDLNNNELNDAISLMINHEQQHQELMLTDLKHALSINPCYPSYQEPMTLSNQPALSSQPTLNNQPAPLDWKPFSGGVHQIGHNDENFYFDNEGPQHKSYVEPFKIASRLVTNGEYLEFIKKGGYQEARFWLSEAWYKIAEEKIKSPLYWVKKEGEWYQFTLSGLQPLDPHAPLTHINYFEANAYANSVDKRLPTEQEWEIAAKNVINEKNNKYQLEQFFNTLWQWTSSSYNAYPGFKVPEGAIGEYNGKFMVNQYVLRGGSIATPKGHVRPSYRNFFYPDASWQFTGIRLAESL